MTAAAILVAATPRLEGQSAVRVRHPQSMDCEDCHVAGSAVTAGNAHQVVASQEQLCAECHRDSLQVSHPSGVPASRTPPPDLPLDREGRVTCSTCHTIHGDRAGRLRGDRRGADFCQSCHEARFFENMRDGGRSIVHSGHIKGLPPAALAIDAFSASCLECHPARATYGGLFATSAAASRHGTGAFDHPVGRDYARSTDYGGYRPPEMLPAAIRLPDGQVSCVSCHEGFTRDHGKLVMSNNRSQLCFGCHDL